MFGFSISIKDSFTPISTLLDPVVILSFLRNIYVDYLKQCSVAANSNLHEVSFKGFTSLKTMHTVTQEFIVICIKTGFSDNMN